MVYEVVAIYAVVYVALTLASTRLLNKLNVVNVTLPVYVFSITFTLTSPYIIDFTNSYTLLFLLLSFSITLNMIRYGRVPFLNYIYIISFFTATVTPFVYYRCLGFSTGCIYFTAKVNATSYFLFTLALVQTLFFNTIIYVNEKIWFNLLVVNLFSTNNLIPMIMVTPSIWVKNTLLVSISLALTYVSKTIGKALYMKKNVDDIHDIYLLLNIPIVIVIVLTLLIVT